MRRVLLWTAGALALWFVLLLIFDFAFAGRTARKTEERIAESLEATAKVGDVDLALVRGRMVLDQMSIRRDDVIGHLAVDIDHLHCELAPLGFALFDNECRELSVRGARLEISSAMLFKLKPKKRPPIAVGRLVIDDAILTFAPSALLPSLGRVAIKIEHAEAGRTVLHTPVSWLLRLESLRAEIDLPAGLTVKLDFHNGMLTAAGTLFGSAPVQLPVQLPVATIAKDAQEELAQLVRLGTDTAERLVAKRAQDWLRNKLSL